MEVPHADPPAPSLALALSIDQRELSAAIRFRRTGYRCEICRPHGRMVTHLKDPRAPSCPMMWDAANRHMRVVMPSQATEHQRELMRSLYKLHNGDPDLTCAAYAQAEVDGRAYRKRGSLRLSPEDYARGLLADGLHKGWLISTP